MEIRTETRTVTALDSLPSTDRECFICDDGHFVRDGHELICDNCQHSPSFETRQRSQTAWEQHRRDVHARAYGERDGRPRLVGGYEDAYWTEDDGGEYEYSPRSGFQF
jgi:hypothetical protein